MLGLLVAASPLEHVVSHDLFHVGPIVVNNHMLMSAVAALLMLIVFVPMTRYRSLVPSGVRNFFESICVYFRDEVARPILHDETDRFIGVIWTTFFFILFANLLGIIPIAAIVYLVSRGELHEWGGTATGNIYVTGALAGFMFVFIHLSGIAQNVRHQRHAGRSPITAGLFGVAVYLYKMVPHIEGALGIILFLPLLGLEFLGAVVKSVALAIRLFANMIAGHILLAVLATHEVALRHPHMTGEGATTPDTRYTGSERLARMGLDHATVHDALTGDRVPLTADPRPAERYLEEAASPDKSRPAGSDTSPDPGTGPLVDLLLTEPTRARQLIEALRTTPDA